MAKILKGIIHLGTVVVIVVSVLSLLGIIENSFGNSFGFGDRTNYASMLLILAFAYIIVDNGWLTWIGQLSLLALDAYVLWIGGKTSFICLLIMTFVLMIRHYREEGKIPFTDKERFGALRYIFLIIYTPVSLALKIGGKLKFRRLAERIKVLLVFSYPIFAVTNLLLVFTVKRMLPFWSAIPFFETFKDRLIFSYIGFEEYPISLVGRPVPVTEFSEFHYTDDYFVIDSGYIRLLLEYGTVAFALFLIVFTLFQFYNYKNRNNLNLIMFSLLSLSFMIEFQIFNLMFLSFLAASVFYITDVPDYESVSRFNLAKLSSGTRWMVATLSLFVALVFAVVFKTSYEISGWRGWVPEYGATVVVPRQCLNADEDLLSNAASYLSAHPDAYCIVYCENDRLYLVKAGIPEDRIYIGFGDDIDEILVNADTIIASNDLPNRLTVCAYSMQQERISRHAENLGIPVNGIAVKPERHYLSLFASEQWRLVCGR